MHTIDNGDGTFTHTIEPGDVTEAIAQFHAYGTNSFLIDEGAASFRMSMERAWWPPAAFTGTVRYGGQIMGNDPDETGYQQPSLGLIIGWNRPQAHWWQPYLVLDLGLWHATVGWLYD